ncbi:MAG: hypothetical protein R3B13_32225 [Polyangiaceae bacterium]
MNRYPLLRTLTLTGLLAVGLFAQLGCELACTENENSQGGICVAKSLTRFKGEPKQQAIPWSPGQGVQIDGVNGDIEVLKGESADVVVSFYPFSYRARDSSEAAHKEIVENLAVTATAGDPIQISSQRDGGSDALGARIVVALPPAFDGALSVKNAGDSPINPGNVRIVFVGASTSVTLQNGGIGSCTLDGGPALRQTQVRCGGRAEVSGVHDDVDVETTSLETGTAIRVSLGSVGPNAKGGTIKSRDGHVEVTLPGAGNYGVVASSPTQGSVQLGSPPASCTTTAASPWQVTCGQSGASYEIVAGEDGLGDSDVVLTYE